MRYIGVDLHTTQITVCCLTVSAEVRIEKYQLCEIEKFVSQLDRLDELAVEAGGNTRWFVAQVKERVSRVVVVNPRSFEVGKNSCRKTDRNDAINPARFLKADLLPEARLKSEYLRKYYEQVKARRGHGKAKIALARKFLTIIYTTLSNSWIFADFNNFELAE